MGVYSVTFSMDFAASEVQHHKDDKNHMRASHSFHLSPASSMQTHFVTIKVNEHTNNIKA